MRDQPTLLIAAGGTGGHMFPAQSLAEEMLTRGWRVRLSTDARGASYAGGFPDAVEIDQVSSASPSRGGVLAKLAMPFRILAGIAMASQRMLRQRPDMVVGFGGYPTIPALSAAILTGTPRIIHEQNGVLGRVNHRFAPHVAEVACGTWPTQLPAKAKGVHVGNPVRADVRERAGAPYIPPGDYPMNVVIIGGSQGARVLTDTIPAAIAKLPAEIKTHLHVSHQARPEDIERAKATYAEAGITAEVDSFFDDIPRRISEAQLVVARAGASTLAEIAMIGRPSVLIPLPYATGDHQAANASVFAEAGAAEMLVEHELSVEGATWAMASILSDAQKAEHMARAALSLSRPNAAQDLADHVEALRRT